MLTFFVAFWKWKYISFFISLPIPRPLRSEIQWPINFSTKKWQFCREEKGYFSWREEKGHFSFLNCQNFVTIFCQVLKMEIIFFDIHSNPPPFAVRNHWPINFSKKNYVSVYFQQEKVTILYRDIHPGDSWPYTRFWGLFCPPFLKSDVQNF